jgi:hypothetical protein
VRGVRTGEPDVFFAVMLHVVPLASERIKPFFASQPQRTSPRRVQSETGLDRFREGGSRMFLGLGTIDAPRAPAIHVASETAHRKHCCHHLSDFWRYSKLTLMVRNVVKTSSTRTPLALVMRRGFATTIARVARGSARKRPVASHRFEFAVLRRFPVR